MRILINLIWKITKILPYLNHGHLPRYWSVVSAMAMVYALASVYAGANVSEEANVVEEANVFVAVEMEAVSVCAEIRTLSAVNDDESAIWLAWVKVNVTQTLL